MCWECLLILPELCGNRGPSPDSAPSGHNSDCVSRMEFLNTSRERHTRHHILSKPQLESSFPVFRHNAPSFPGSDAFAPPLNSALPIAENRPVMAPQRKGRGYVNVPPLGVIGDPGPDLDEPFDQPLDRAPHSLSLDVERA